MSETLTGGCACGTIRYRLDSPPFDTGWCHCRICQLSSGAPALAFSTVPVEDFVLLSGNDAVKSYRSTSFGERLFCRNCGTLLAMKVAHQPDTIDFTVATLERPEAAPPGFHIFHASRIAWFETADTLPRHERFRPDTRGLETSDPPA